MLCYYIILVPLSVNHVINLKKCRSSSVTMLKIEEKYKLATLPSIAILFKVKRVMLSCLP